MSKDHQRKSDQLEKDIYRFLDRNNRGITRFLPILLIWSIALAMEYLQAGIVVFVTLLFVLVFMKYDPVKILVVKMVVHILSIFTKNE